MEVTLGGDRLGSGNKNKVYLHDYERSTHDLSTNFTSSLQCGTLYPFLVLPAMRGDRFDIDLDAAARTIPTKGPLFGRFKMQVDVFQCDVRLYQALLHNNPVHLGLNMSKVKFPILEVRDRANRTNTFSNTCLLKYLGISGLGVGQGQNTYVKRNINAIPALAYYEIFKTYYSNKQEDNAYVIGNETKTYDIEDFKFKVWFMDSEPSEEKTAIEAFDAMETFRPINANVYPNWQNEIYCTLIHLDAEQNETYKGCWLFSELLKKDKIGILENGHYFFNGNNTPDNQSWTKCIFSTNYRSSLDDDVQTDYTYEQWGLQPFALANIDDMRLKLLSHHELGVPFKIVDEVAGDINGIWGKGSGTDGTGLPYINLVKMENVTKGTLNRNPLNGLVVKTYQSDLYNNWVNTEWIDRENGIAEVTAISTEEGSIKIDSINLAEKLYNMLNRIAVSDGSYEGWQDAVYTETPKRHIESPIYLGGMSSEIMFEEIVQTSNGDENNPLGTLAGKGILVKDKGGHVEVQCNEAAFIIGIVSLTPRVNYTQGNEWYMTELQSMDDFHKPALDGIGFQNLIGERLAWWDTKINQQGEIVSRSVIGKVPAWIEYMTNIDRCYGDFAETEGKGFMALQRDYGRTGDDEIEDATTYIDPRKFNYAFAYTEIDAQNFWVQIHCDIKARRLMSAKQIPNI